MSELTKRVLVSLAAVPLVLAAAYVGRAPLAALLGIVAALGAWELQRIAAAGGVRPLALGIGLAAAVPLLVQAHYERVYSLPLSVAAAAMLVIVAASIWARGVSGRPLAASAITIFSPVSLSSR